MINLQISELCEDVAKAHELGVPSKLSSYLDYIELVILK